MVGNDLSQYYAQQQAYGQYNSMSSTGIGQAIGLLPQSSPPPVEQEPNKLLLLLR